MFSIINLCILLPNKNEINSKTGSVNIPKIDHEASVALFSLDLVVPPLKINNCGVVPIVLPCLILHQGKLNSLIN